MKKKLNIIFFGLCFLGSVMAEAYFFQLGEENLFSVIALGIVVLITGYLLMDSIRSKLSEYSEVIKSQIDQLHNQNIVRWDERVNDMQNLQKASYTATKKNTEVLSKQLEEIINRVEVLEANQANTLQKLIDLQMKAMEGQKKALNIEVNHNKENTRQLMQVIAESGNQAETLEVLNKIADQLKDTTQVLQQELKNMSINVQVPSMENPESSRAINAEPRIEDVGEMGWGLDTEIEPEAELELNAETEQDKELVLDTAISGWNSDTTSYPEDEDIGWNSSVDTEQTELNNDWSIVDNQGELSNQEVIEPQTPIKEITPLYEDANKALSADEIAALFASFGQ